MPKKRFIVPWTGSYASGVKHFLVVRLGVLMLAMTAMASAAPPSPAAVERDAQAALRKVEAACVSVGEGSGVIISPEGHVLTAAHVIDNQRFLAVEFDDGRKAIAKPIGADVANDVALLKIVSSTESFENVDPEALEPQVQQWPYAELAEKAPGIGAFCFSMSHPGTRKPERPAQFRLGRITHFIHDGALMSADSTVEPGDSGGGLFDLGGRVVGITVFGTVFPGANMFAKIDTFHASRQRIENGEFWGEPPFPDPFMSEEEKDKLKVAARRHHEILMETDYAPVIESYIDTHNGLPIEEDLALSGALDHIAHAALWGVPYELGMQDPEVLTQWPAEGTPLTRPLRVVAEPSLRSFGLPVSERHLIVKWSVFGNHNTVKVQVGEGMRTATLINGNVDWDLALFDLGEELLTPVKFADTNVSRAQALASPDANGVLLWGFTSDVARRIELSMAPGPLYFMGHISRHRGPYQRATSHDVPLLALDAGRPLYNLKGECVGLHLARFSRSTGLMVAGEDVNALYRQWLDEGPTPDIAYPLPDLSNPTTDSEHMARNRYENLLFSQAGMEIAFYLEVNGNLPPSIEAIDDPSLKAAIELNGKRGIEIIYLVELTKKDKLEDPASTPVIIAPLYQGKHTVAYADGRVARVATEELQKQLENVGIPMPANASAAGDSRVSDE